jgi:hypothetical protein
MEEMSLDDHLESEGGSAGAKEKETTPVLTAPLASISSSVEVDPALLQAVEAIDLLKMPIVDLPSLLNYTFECDMYTDMRFPLRDREFVEAFVRIIAEASSRKHAGGVSGSGLFDNVYRMLAETVSTLAVLSSAASTNVTKSYFLSFVLFVFVY